jgi:hypothetical protein
VADGGDEQVKILVFMWPRPKRPRRERREFYRIVALDALLGPEPQADSRIVAGLRDSSIQRKELLGGDKDSFQFEQAFWQACLPQDCIRRNA